MRILAAIFATALLSARASCATDEFGRLMDLLKTRERARSEYIEQQFSSLLKRPLESRGELVYEAPDHLEKRTIEPRAETLVVDGDQIVVQRGRRRHQWNLRDYPPITPFVASIRAILAGDRAGLERVFRVEFAGNLARWSMALRPLDAALAKSVAEIQIDGARDNLLHIEIKQTDGDRSLMTLRAAAPP
jgi:outer membrane lipoprotein carrier protein LolA